MTLLETAERLRDGGSLRDILGLRSRTFWNAFRPLIPDLDSLGNMVHDGLAVMVEARPPEERTGYVVSSRGCYGRCSFCGVPDFYRRLSGRPWRGRGAEAVVGELRVLAERFKIRRFVFLDDNFMGPGAVGHARAKQIATEILGHRLDIQYSLCCRLNDLRADTLELLKASGLHRIGVSVESANQDSLDLFDKGLKSQRIYDALGLLETLQLEGEINLIFFEPSMNLDGVRRNLALIEYLRGSDYLSYSDAFPFNELKPFAWSRIAKRLRAEGLLDEDTYTCRFKDLAVAQLARFVGRLRCHLPLIFKRRLPSTNIDDAQQDPKTRNATDELIWLTSGFRHWVGLSVLPRYLSEACDILERDAGQWEEELNELETRFHDETKVLRMLEQSVQASLRLSHDDGGPSTRIFNDVSAKKA